MPAYSLALARKLGIIYPFGVTESLLRANLLSVLVKSQSLPNLALLRLPKVQTKINKMAAYLCNSKS